MPAADRTPSGPVPTSAQSARRVLVAYATRFGSTRGVAERIAAQLRERDQEVQLSACDGRLDATGYDAVVIGSAVFNQRWLPEADEFVRRNLPALAARPVWLFSVGTFGDDKAIIGGFMRREPRNITELGTAIHPRGYRVFAGAIKREQWPWASRLLYHALGGRLGDNRDWKAIDDWATVIARALDRAHKQAG